MERQNTRKLRHQERSIDPSPNALTTKYTASSDMLDCSSPKIRSSMRKNSLIRKSIVLPNGWTLHDQLDFILTKPERSLNEARILYEAIKDFPIMNLLFAPPGERALDTESILYLIQRIKLMKIDPGHIVYSQEDPSDGKLYIVYEGEIALVIKDPDHITTKNYERFENEQKKRTINKLGSFKNLRAKNLNNIGNQNSSRFTDLKKTPRQLEKEEKIVEEEVEDKPAEISNDHVFQLLKSYMTTNYIPHKNIMKEEVESLKEGVGEKPVVDKDLARMSGVTRAFVKFKKVIKQRNNVLNSAKEFGVVRDRLEIGGYFGGTIDFEMRKREETAFALKPTELLVIEYKDLNHAKTNFSKKKIALKNFMFDSFPKLDLYQSEKIVTGLLSTLEERTFEGNVNIVTEGQPGEYFYILQSGTCEISKEITINEGHALDHIVPQSRALLRVQPNTKKKIPLTSISQGVFFGDELVYQAQKYYFSVKVTSSKATCIAINNKTFAARFPQVVFDSLKALYQKRIHHYVEKIKTYLLSSQFDGYEIVSDLSILSLGDKKAVLDRMNIKDLCNPIKLRPKKKLPSSLIKNDINLSKHNSSPSLGQLPLPPQKNPSTLSPLVIGSRSPKEIFLDQNYQSHNQGNDLGLFESKEKLKNLVSSPTMKKSKTHSAMSSLTEKEIKGLNWAMNSQSQQEGGIFVPDCNETTLNFPSISGHGGKLGEELERIKGSYRTRTILNADSPKLKHITLQGKDHISYINSNKPFYKGTLDIKTFDDDNKSHSSHHEHTANNGIETLKLGIEFSDRDNKKQLSARKGTSRFKGSTDLHKSNIEKEGHEREETPKEILPRLWEDNHGELSRIKKSQYKLNIQVNTGNIPEVLSAKNSPLYQKNLKDSDNLNSSQMKFGWETPSISFVRNNSVASVNNTFIRDVNPLDVQTSKDINEYIAKKKHLKLKEKIFMESFESLENSVSNKISPKSKASQFFVHRGQSQGFEKKGFNKEELDMIIKGNANKKRKSLKSKALNSSDGTMEELKKKDEANKKTSLVQWQNNQTLLLKEKGRIHQQLKRKGLKGFSPYELNTDIELKGSPKLLNSALGI